MSLNWTTDTTRTGKRVWISDGGMYTFTSRGSSTVLSYGAGGRARRHTSTAGYEVVYHADGAGSAATSHRGRVIASMLSSVASAKASACRHQGHA